MKHLIIQAECWLILHVRLARILAHILTSTYDPETERRIA